MAYIYKITNEINGKIYIGKTFYSLEKRFKEHCRDSFKNRNEKRPLYSAMNKYGIENFSISLLEETNNPDEREKFWIEKLGTFKYGYNATLGGDGTQYADYDLIYSLYRDNKTYQEIQDITKYDIKTIRLALEEHGISKQDRLNKSYQHLSKPVAKIDLKTGEILEIYPSTAEAERMNGNSKHIASVCVGKRKSCKGYGWKYV